MGLIDAEIVKSGLIAGALVAGFSAVTVVGVGTLANDTGEGILGFAGKWVAISLVFGVVAAAAFGVLNGSLGWGASGYLALATGMAVVLTVLEFLPIYGTGGFAPHWQVYAVLNFVYGLGFGFMIPRFMA